MANRQESLFINGQLVTSSNEIEGLPITNDDPQEGQSLVWDPIEEGLVWDAAFGICYGGDATTVVYDFTLEGGNATTTSYSAVANAGDVTIF